MTLLAVPITRGTTDEAMADIRRAVGGGGADAVELRLDYMTGVDVAEAVAVIREVGGAKTTVIMTARDPAEGGQWRLDDAQRIAMLVKAAPTGPDYVDVELATWRRCPEARRELTPLLGDGRGRFRLILSSHDFDGRPADVEAIVAATEAEPCHVVKIVWRAESVCDNFTCFELMRGRQGRAPEKPVIAIAMGEAGLPSRVLAKKFGAFLSFASIEADAGSAPGQVTLGEMKHLYRWDAIRPTTGVYGVIGCPIMHSMSPAIHNAAMSECDVDGVYVPLRIEPGYEPFAAFVRGAMDRPWMDVRGLSVTIPHKENALRFLDEVGGEVEPLARKIGAVNTLVFDGADTVGGLNTDYAGARDALLEAMGCDRSELTGVPVAILGAGGASRALVAGLRDCGCDVTIYNRTFSRAETLAAEFGCRAEPLDRAGSLKAKIVVNTTSIGMHPNVEATPLPGEALRRDMVVFDNVYNPMETRLLREAGAIGCLTVSGVDMFVRQAVAQFESWTGRQAPREVMRRVVVDRLTRH
ncbi:MAG: shikimate dehydrogenase [Phycisphaerae bacterium]|nr:shikimate dehydrogenase [Phycisphaerae bacterium]